MKNHFHPTTQNTLRAVRNFLRRFLGIGPARERTREDAGSYVGLFQGFIETDALVAPVPPPVPDGAVSATKPLSRPQARMAARASGFLRLEVNDQKRATGCFLFFVDGKVVSGDIEGASEGTGFVEASFRLDTARADASGRSGPRPVSAVGKLHLEARHARGPAAPGEDLTIRFV